MTDSVSQFGLDPGEAEVLLHLVAVLKKSMNQFKDTVSVLSSINQLRLASGRLEKTAISGRASLTSLVRRGLLTRHAKTEAFGLQREFQLFLDGEKTVNSKSNERYFNMLLSSKQLMSALSHIYQTGVVTADHLLSIWGRASPSAVVQTQSAPSVMKVKAASAGTTKNSPMNESLPKAFQETTVLVPKNADEKGASSSRLNLDHSVDAVVKRKARDLTPLSPDATESKDLTPEVGETVLATKEVRVVLTDECKEPKTSETLQAPTSSVGATQLINAEIMMQKPSLNIKGQAVLNVIASSAHAVTAASLAHTLDISHELLQQQLGELLALDYINEDKTKEIASYSMDPEQRASTGYQSSAEPAFKNIHKFGFTTLFHVAIRQLRFMELKRKEGNQSLSRSQFAEKIQLCTGSDVKTALVHADNILKTLLSMNMVRVSGNQYRMPLKSKYAFGAPLEGASLKKAQDDLRQDPELHAIYLKATQQPSDSEVDALDETIAIESQRVSSSEPAVSVAVVADVFEENANEPIPEQTQTVSGTSDISAKAQAALQQIAVMAEPLAVSDLAGKLQVLSALSKAFSFDQHAIANSLLAVHDYLSAKASTKTLSSRLLWETEKSNEKREHAVFIENMLKMFGVSAPDIHAMLQDILVDLT